MLIKQFNYRCLAGFYTNGLWIEHQEVNIEPDTIVRKVVKTGLLINNAENLESIQLQIPSQKIKNVNMLFRSSYYRCYTKDRFRVSISLEETISFKSAQVK